MPNTAGVVTIGTDNCKGGGTTAGNPQMLKFSGATMALVFSMALARSRMVSSEIFVWSGCAKRPLI